MKLASFLIAGELHFGTVGDDGLRPASPAFRERYRSLRCVLAGEAVDALAADCQNAVPIEAAAVEFLPPVPDAARVTCVGINYPKLYPAAAGEPGNIGLPSSGRPEHLILFAKLPGTLLGHGAQLEIPTGAASETFDYEGEIAVIIGKPGRHIQAAQAYEHVAGYTVLNDGSVRGWQKHSVHAGKNFAGSGACGPWMVTADEIAAPQAMTLTTRLNGRVVQHAASSEMFFQIPYVISYVSHLAPLAAGDIIAMGSPHGAGGSQTPPRFLKAGDRLEIEVSGVGILANSVGKAPATG